MVQKRAKVEKPAAGQPLRRGRPRQYDPDQALAKAAAAFWKGGYAGTSLDELSAATGMNRPSLYAAFGEKRDLYLKTLERYQRKSRAKTLELLADDPPLLTLRFRIAASGAHFDIVRPVRHRYIDRVEGERSRALTVVPPVATEPRHRRRNRPQGPARLHLAGTSPARLGRARRADP